MTFILDFAFLSVRTYLLLYASVACMSVELDGIGPDSSLTVASVGVEPRLAWNFSFRFHLHLFTIHLRSVS